MALICFEEKDAAFLAILRENPKFFSVSLLSLDMGIC